MKRTLAREVMTTTVVTAGEAMPLRHLAGLLHASDIGAVPVTGPERRVPDADLAARAAAAGPPPSPGPCSCARGAAGSTAGPRPGPPAS